MISNKKVGLLSIAIAMVFVSSCALYDPFAGEDPYANSGDGPTTISGSFVQPWFIVDWTADTWKREMQDMKAAGVDNHVIWQWTVDSKTMKAYYPTALPGFAMVEDMASADPIADCLAEAKAAGMQVWLGLNDNGDWWGKYADDETWLKNEFAISRAVAKDLWDRYGGEYSDAIAGFYFTMEVNNIFFWTSWTQERMKIVYQKTADYIHGIAPGKKVMVAPYAIDSVFFMNQQSWQAMWEKILAEANIDVINMQDGCGAGNGTTTHTSVETVRSWFAATRKAIDNARPATELWSDLETFDMDAKGNCFCVVEFGRIEKQIEAVRPYVKRISSFAVMHYQTKVGVDAGSKPTEQYELLKALQLTN